jgi:hypothetical protein
VRRVGVSLTVLGISFEHQLLSVFSNAEAMRAFNPLVRVPALVLDDGECLIDSAAIRQDKLAKDRRCKSSTGKERMPRTQCRNQHVTEAASPWIGAAWVPNIPNADHV